MKELSSKTNKQAASASMEAESGGVGLLFLSNFVHQVVNPLSGVIGTLSNIAEGTYPDEDIAKQKINACRAQLEQCVSLIRNLAFLSDYFSDSEDKVLRPAREMTTSVLPQVIIESIQFLQTLGERKGIRLELTESKKQYRVKVRPELLKQVFINIFDNWLKYGEHTQTIEAIPSVNSSGDLIVVIKGKSIGFDGNDAENIFKLGFRSTEAKQAVAQGSGIGLHICKQIMENALGGTIRAEHNKATKVTTFRIMIPKNKWEL
jgi:signal transduction histidine kinase